MTRSFSIPEEKVIGIFIDCLLSPNVWRVSPGLWLPIVWAVNAWALNQLHFVNKNLAIEQRLSKHLTWKTVIIRWSLPTSHWNAVEIRGWQRGWDLSTRGICYVYPRRYQGLLSKICPCFMVFTIHLTPNATISQMSNLSLILLFTSNSSLSLYPNLCFSWGYG